MKDDHVAVLLEDMNDKFDAMTEIVVSIREEMKTMARQEDLIEIKEDIKAAVTDLSNQVDDHEVRITTLEGA